ncbi:MAG: thioredoxin domain-containing protein [Pseudomonadota bacterium]
MIRGVLSSLILLTLSAATTATAEPILRIINFTADWCPNCRVLDPRMAEALEAFPDGEIEMVNLDMTNARAGQDEITIINTHNEAIRLADSVRAGYLWDWYGGRTGIATVIAADNGEPITCFMRVLSVKQIEDRLKLARILALRAPPGQRKPQGPDCPAPMN